MTNKDQEILQLRAEGKTYGAIAKALTSKGMPITENYVNKRYLTLKKREGSVPEIAPEPKQVPTMSTGLTEAQLRERHDMFFQL